MEFRHALLLLAVGLLCASLCESRPGRDRGEGRGGPGRGGAGSDRRPPGQGRKGQGKVLACSTTPGDDVLTCGDSVECNAGPLSVVFNGEDVDVTFCNRPFKPKKEDVCNVTDAEGNEKDVCHDLKECTGAESCIVGPIPHRHRDRVNNLYLCGTQNVIPEVDYAEIVKEKACGRGNELDHDACGDEGSCTGPVVEVDDVTLTFCVKDSVEDDDRTLLDLINRRGKGNRRSGEEEEEEEDDEDEDEDDDECEDRGRNGRGRSGEGRRGQGQGREGQGGQGQGQGREGRGGQGQGRQGRG